MGSLPSKGGSRQPVTTGDQEYQSHTGPGTAHCSNESHVLGPCVTCCPTFSGTDPILGTWSSGPQKTSRGAVWHKWSLALPGLFFWAVLGPGSECRKRVMLRWGGVQRLPPLAAVAVGVGGHHMRRCRASPPLHPALHPTQSLWLCLRQVNGENEIQHQN